MSLSLAAGAGPIFLSQNYLTRDADVAGDLITSGASQATAHRLYQMDPSIQWATIGSGDGTSETIVFGLYQGTIQTAQTIDFVALFNINLKRFIVEYSANNGGSWTTVPGGDYTGADFSGTDLVLNPTQFSANKLRVTATKVQGSGVEKKVGTIVCALSTFQAQNWISYRPNRAVARNDVKLADGTLDYTYLLWSDNSFELYSSDISWQYLTAAQRALLRTLATQTAPFLCYPEPGDLVEDIHLCCMAPGSYRESYSVTSKTSGWDISIKVQEVGY